MNPLEELADRQWRDYRARQPGTCFADPDFVLSLAEAYELQDAVAKLRIAAGDRLIGYKVGCTGPGTVQQFGMQGPIRGCLFESEVRRHGDTLNFDDFAGLAIEGEMAVRIGVRWHDRGGVSGHRTASFRFQGAYKNAPGTRRQQWLVAVGPGISSCPPHRSRRAAFPHRALAGGRARPGGRGGCSAAPIRRQATGTRPCPGRVPLRGVARLEQAAREARFS